jgi:hypothetical protein
LDILQGAEGLLCSGVVGVKLEVEFSPLYHELPLFAELDTCLRGRGFTLFDLSRNRYRREGSLGIPTRGQLVFGDAVYFRDWHELPANSTRMAARLCVAAAVLEFHDYALEVLDALEHGHFGSLAAEEVKNVSRVRASYAAARAVAGQLRPVRLAKLAIRAASTRRPWWFD